MMFLVSLLLVLPFSHGFLSPPIPISTLSHLSSSSLRVLRTPEAVFERASTQDLLDDLIDESVRLSARRPIMLQFEPSGAKIWRRWRGTIFSETWRNTIRNMLFASAVGVYFRLHPSMKARLAGFSILWQQLLGLTTFTLTFFLNVSYGLWRKCYQVSRRLQGRLNDLGLGLCIHATRTTPSEEDREAGVLSEYTKNSRQVLSLISRYVRVFNLLVYASYARSHRPILTPRGMRRLVERGLITENERVALCNDSVLATQRHNAVIMWIGRIFVEAREAGHIQGGAGYEMQFLDKIHVIRSQYGAIGDELSGRMPFAYAHIVQVLVDVVLWLYPLMAYPSGMSFQLGVIGTGLLTMFYQGLFDLAKQFLDPYDNENFGQGDDPLSVDTLVAETNAGSVRWLNGFEFQPFSSKGIQTGEMEDELLPIQGYSLEQMEKRKEMDEMRKFAEEEKEEQLSFQELEPPSLEDVSKLAEEELSVAQLELFETEAILNAEPMANSLEPREEKSGKEEKERIGEKKAAQEEEVEEAKKKLQEAETSKDIISEIENILVDSVGAVDTLNLGLPLTGESDDTHISGDDA